MKTLLLLYLRNRYFWTLLALLYDTAMVEPFQLRTEKIKSLTMEACSLERSVQNSEIGPYKRLLDDTNQLTWCVTVKTDKTVDELERDLQKTTRLKPLVQFRWQAVGQSQADSCLLTYKVAFLITYFAHQLYIQYLSECGKAGKMPDKQGFRLIKRFWTSIRNFKILYCSCRPGKLKYIICALLIPLLLGNSNAFQKWCYNIG